MNIKSDVDFSIRVLEDPNFLELVMTNPIELFKQEIITLLSTHPSEELCDDIDFDLDYMINNLNITNSQIKSYIFSAIKQNCSYANVFDFKVDVNFIKQQINDVAVVDIDIIEDSIDDESKKMRFVF